MTRLDRKSCCVRWRRSGSRWPAGGASGYMQARSARRCRHRALRSCRRWQETLALAKTRAVDGDLLGELGQLLPTVYVAANTEGDTIGTRFAGKLRAHPAVQLDPAASDPNAEPQGP